MSHTTQEPKPMQLAAELDYRREYEAALHRTPDHQDKAMTT